MSEEQYDPYMYDDSQSITPEDCWTVITSFFQEKGLVSQQLDSFDEFIESTIQELIWEDSHLILDQPAQHTSDKDNKNKRYEITFGKMYISKPSQTEGDGTTHLMFPQEARLRNLTYSAPLYVDMSKKVFESDDNNRKDNELEWKEQIVQEKIAIVKCTWEKYPSW